MTEISALLLLLSTVLVLRHLYVIRTRRPAAATFYIAVDGRSENPGTISEPWDIVTALNGSKRRQIIPGSTLLLRGGIYKASATALSNSFEDCHGFSVNLKGTPNAPIVVKPYNHEHVILDGGLSLGEAQNSVSHVWFFDFEVTVTERRNLDAGAPIPAPVSGRYNVPFPWGGVTIQNGVGVKIINFVIHGNCQGIGWWTKSSDSEVYGCIIYDNGWYATDRPHGHGIYAQNREPSTKTLEDCLLIDGVEKTLFYAQGSASAHLQNFTLKHNAFYTTDTAKGLVIIGGGGPVKNARIVENYFCNVDLTLGHRGTPNISCLVDGNIIDNGSLTISDFPDSGCSVVQNEVYQENSPIRPDTPQIIFRRNKYDENRGNVLVYTFSTEATVIAIDFAHFLRPGDVYTILQPKDLWGVPIAEGIFAGEKIELHFRAAFSAYVVVKNRNARQAR